jgi:DNA-binding beta-propeller fold protein YncE
MRVPASAALLATAALLSCAPAPPSDPPPSAGAPVPAATPFEDRYESRDVPLGEPLAVAVDFKGRALIADGSPGRIVRWGGDAVEEFKQPTAGVGFYPTDVAIQGFFVYAVDEGGRRILRFDDTGHYRDVLLNFERLDLGRRVSPYSIAVDAAGRLAVTDVENGQILVFDAYLSLELAFGNYGTYEGQLSSPRGVAFGRGGEIVVADTGNRRVQVFTAGGAFDRVVPGRGVPNPLVRPRRAVEDESGRIFVADPRARSVFVFDEGGGLVRVVAPAGQDRFEPTDVAVTRAGRLFVADGANRTVYVFEGL